MELWVRSQNKDGLAKIHSINIEEKTSTKFSIVGNNEWILGIYETEKRALEVLDHIQFLIEQTGELTEKIVEDIRELLKDEMWSINSTSNTATYVMPKE